MHVALRIVKYTGCLLVFAVRSLFAEEMDTALRDRFLDAVKNTGPTVEQLHVKIRCAYARDFAWISEDVHAKLKKVRSDPLRPENRTYEVVIHGKNTAESGVYSDGLEYVVARNARYAFRISRAPHVEHYSLDFLERVTADSRVEPRIEEIDREARAIPLCTWYLVGHTVSHFVESPFFEIKGVSRVSHDGQEFVRIDFEHLVDDAARKAGEWFSDGYMVCDPQRNWALREYQAVLWDGCVYHVEIEVGESLDKFPLPRKMTRLITKENVSTRRMVATFEVIGEDISEEEFHLSHFGLSEPAFRQSAFGAWVWYLVAGLICMSVGLIVLRRRKSRV